MGLNRSGYAVNHIDLAPRCVHAALILNRLLLFFRKHCDFGEVNTTAITKREGTDKKLNRSFLIHSASMITVIIIVLLLTIIVTMKITRTIIKMKKITIITMMLMMI